MPEEYLYQIADKTEAALRENSFNSDADAYKKFHDEAQALFSRSSSDNNQDEIRRQLESRQILPDLCIGFLKHHFLELDENKDGKLTVEELQSAKDENKDFFSRYWNKVTGKDNIDQVFINELAKRGDTFNIIAYSGPEHSIDAIEMSDLISQSQQRLQSFIKEDSRKLFDGYGSSLMAFVDEKDGQYDGYASAEDIQRKVQQYRTAAHQGFGSLQQKIVDKNILEEIAEGKHPELLRDGALDVVAIMRKAGLTPDVVNYRADYVSVTADLQRSNDRAFSKWLTKDRLTHSYSSRGYYEQLQDNYWQPRERSEQQRGYYQPPRDGYGRSRIYIRNREFIEEGEDRGAAPWRNAK